MTLQEIRSFVNEAIRYDPLTKEIKVGFRREDPNDFEKKTTSVGDKEINTDLRWGGSLGTRGQAEVYRNPRHVDTKLEGKRSVVIYHVYRRRTGKERRPDDELLTAVKSMSYPEAERVLTHATSHLAKVFARWRTPADVIIPAPSSKPLAGRFAAELSKILNAPVADVFDKTHEAKTVAPNMRPKTQLVAMKPGAEDKAYDKDVIVVDDITCADQTVCQMAKLLFDKSLAKSVTAVVLIGRA